MGIQQSQQTGALKVHLANDENIRKVEGTTLHAGHNVFPNQKNSPSKKDVSEQEDIYDFYSDHDTTAEDEYAGTTDKTIHTNTKNELATIPYQLRAEVIKEDLTTDLPGWLLSAYGPGRDAPAQLFGGFPREQCPEELRLRHYELAAAGKAEQAMQEAQVLVNTAETQNRNALSDIDGAIKYILDGKDRHPTRVEIVDNINRAFKGLAPTSSTPFSATASPFVAASNTTGAFGQPSIPGLGATSTSSGFGKPSLPGIGSFGQSSGLSARPTTSFGQPTGQSTSLPNPFAQAAQSTISQPAAQNATPSPFGQPSFGAATQPSPFGQPSAPAFGQPSTSGFGQPSAPTFGQQTTSAFGKPTTLPFGQPSGAAAPTTSSAFGAPSNPFARAASASGPSTSAATANPFAKAAATPSPFAAPAQPQSAFGAPNPFAQSSTPAQPAQAAQRTSNGNSQPSSGNTLRDTSGKLKMWNGKAVEYLNNEYPCFRRPDGKLQRIWFPDGPPQWVKPPDVPDSAYDDEIQKQFMHIKQNGTFKDGTMPMLPPKRDWVDWNM